MKFERYNFTDDMQDVILACLIRYPKKFFSFGQIIKPAFFNGPVQVETVFHLIEYQKKYSKYPSFTMLGNFAFAKVSRTNVDHANKIVDYVAKLSETDTDDWLSVLDLCIDFAKERAIYDAVRKIHAAQSEGKMVKINAVETIEEAMRVGTNYDDLGKSLYHHSNEVIDIVTKRNYGVMTGYPELDAVWKFGWAPGWLIVPLAPPKRYKCESPENKLLMYDGTVKKAKDIKVGDLLMGDDSTPRTVLTCGTGYGPMFHVEQSNGDAYSVTDDHLLCVCREERTVPKGTHFKTRYPAERIKEITAKDYCRQSAWFQRTWKGYKVNVNFPDQPVPLDPYFLGLWLGDGTSSKPEICVADKDKEIAAYLRSYANSLKMRITLGKGTGCRQFQLVRTPKRSAKCSVRGCLKPQMAGSFCAKHYATAWHRGFKALAQGQTHYTNPITESLKKLEVYRNKHIPNVYKFNARAIRLKLLAGMIDSDGNYSKNNGFIFSNSNRRLADDACWLARSLGFKAYTRKVKTRIRSIGCQGTAFRTIIQGKISEIPTKIPRKMGIDSAKATNRTTLKVKPIGNGKYYGFELDGNRRYLHSDFTVTHNTTFCLNLALNMACKLDTDVLYYACEISQELAMMRAIYNLTGFTEEQIFRNPEKLKPLVKQKLKQKMFGNVWFKGYPSKSVNLSQIRDHAKQTIQIYGLNPKAIFIDYAETVKPDKVGKDVPDWRQQADIYIQARALGAELGCAVIMPDRCNKEAVGRSVPSMKSFQGSFEKAGVVDVAIGLCADDSEHQQNRIRYFIFLNRHGESLLHYAGRVDPEHMKMTIDKKIDYKPDEEEETKPYRRGTSRSRSKGLREVKRDMEQDAASTQKD